MTFFKLLLLNHAHMASRSPKTSGKTSRLSLKVHGVPLQTLYAAVNQLPKTPEESEIIEGLQKLFKRRKLEVHPRTLKRQLAGQTESVPQILEEIFLTWAKKQPKIPKKLLKTFEKQREMLSLSVEAKPFTQMVDAYLELKKKLNRRQLASQLQKEIKKKNIPLKFDVIQASLAGKNEKVYKIIEDELKVCFAQAGYKTKTQLEKFLQARLASQAKEIPQHVPGKEVGQLVKKLLKKNPELTPRQLAEILREDLLKQGVRFSLDNLQYILTGKTERTRGILLALLEAYLQSEDFQSRFASTNKAGRPSLDRQVAHALNRFNDANQKERKKRYHDFLDARAQLIKNRWQQKKPKKNNSSSSQGKSLQQLLADIETNDPFSNDENRPEDAAVAYDVGAGMDRLVS